MAGTGYRSIATRGVLLWAVSAVLNKLTIAMAPLAFVFFGRELPGGYTVGAALAAVWVLGEVVAAPVLGTWFDPRRATAHLAGGLGVGALAYAGLAAGRDLPTVALFALAFVAGAAPAASPSALRALLTGLVAEEDAAKALSVETVLVGLVWGLAPPLVAGLALGAWGGAPFALGAVLNVAVVALVFRLPPGRAAARGAEKAGTWSTVRTLAWAWPVYLTAAASMAMVSTMELALPALLEHRGMPVAWVGWLLATFWLATVLGAYGYGRRTWPGRPRTHSLVCLLATIAAVTAVAVLPTAAGLAAALAVGGLFQACVLITRNLSLLEALPEEAHAAGYSIMYAATGVGYSITAAVTATVLARGEPAAAIVGGGVVVLVLVLVSAAVETRRPDRAPVPAAP